jgi:protein arginine kinase
MNKWFDKIGTDTDVAISSRVRLARNFSSVPFPNAASSIEASEVYEKVKTALSGGEIGFKRLSEMSEQEKSAMIARHLISPPFSKMTDRGALGLTADESLSIMINEEDHIRIQALSSGNNLLEAYKKAYETEEKISEKYPFAFDETLGYLTACPTNLGTGLRASVMLHLPALSENGDIQNLMGMLSKLGLTIRGTFGESTKSVGNLYQISNQVTLGIDEKNSIGNLSAIVSQIIERERAARRALYENSLSFEDSFHRSMALLSSARLMSGEELYGHLSVIRTGASLGLVDIEKTSVMTRLLFCTSAGEIIMESGRNLTPAERDAIRATEVRNSKLFV